MGAWGYSALDSDEGQEVKERWDTWKESGYEDQQILDLFLKSWGDALRHGDSITNNEVIASAFLCEERKIPIPAKLKKVAVDAINRELEPIELERWENAQAREQFLKDFLAKLGGGRKRPRKARLFSDPALAYGSSNEAKRKLIKSFRAIKDSKYPISLSKAGFPAFLSTLDRFMNHRVWEKDSNIYLEAKKQRLMMLSTYLALNSNMTEQELDSLFHRIDSAGRVQ